MEFQQNNILTWHKMNWNTRHSSLNSFLIGSQFISKTLKKGIQKICFFFSLFFLSWRFLKQIMCRTYFRKQNAIVKQNFIAKSLREKCPNTEFFLVRIFLYSDWIESFTPIYSVNLRIQSKYRQIRTRENSIFEHFSRSTDFLWIFIDFHTIWATDYPSKEKCFYR